VTKLQSTNVTWHDGAVTRDDRQRLLGQRGVTLWMTGLSGSGKSTIGVLVEQMLIQRGKLAYRLDGDNVRHGLNRNLGFSAEDRTENIRRIGEVAKLFTDAGVIVIVSFISPYRKDRAAVRALLQPGEFVEVYVQASLEAAERRDPKGLYKKARAGEIKGFTGIDDPYEAPERAEITLATESHDPDVSAAQVLAYLDAHGHTGAMPVPVPQPQSRLARLFENLSGWRHLPNYQLERRADAFFSLYLQGLVQERVGRPVSPIIVPELPILCSLIWPDRKDMKSVKVDYLLLSEDRSEAYLVELKTDAGSRRDQQDKYLRRACECGLDRLLQGVVDIAKASSSVAKYASLLRLLASAGLVQIPENEPLSAAWFDAARVLPCPPSLRWIYIQPTEEGRDGDEIVSFDAVRQHVERFDDEFSRLFAKHLKGWAVRPGFSEPSENLEDPNTNE
jgi:adenylylsulfate kinase